MSEEIKYPVYRKFKNGKEFMKLNRDGMLIKVNLVRVKTYSIILTDNSLFVHDFYNSEISTESNRHEFEKAYGQAQFQLCKTNCEQ